MCSHRYDAANSDVSTSGKRRTLTYGLVKNNDYGSAEQRSVCVCLCVSVSSGLLPHEMRRDSLVRSTMPEPETAKLIGSAAAREVGLTG